MRGLAWWLAAGLLVVPACAPPSLLPRTSPAPPPPRSGAPIGLVAAPEVVYAVAAPEVQPAEVVEAESSMAGAAPATLPPWMAPDILRRPFRPQIEQWRP